MARRQAPFIVAYGTEEFLLDRIIQTARSWSDRNVCQLDGEGLTDAALVSECEAQSFDQTPRVVIVDDAQAVKGSSELKRYVSERDPSDDSVVLVAIYRKPALPGVWQKAAAKGRTYEHQMPKPWEDQKKAAAVMREAKHVGIKIDELLANRLIDYVGYDLSRIHNELSKMALLATKADEKLLKLVVAPQPAAEAYEVAEAAYSKQAHRAMNKLAFVYKYLGEGASVVIATSLMRLLSKLVVVRQMLDRGDGSQAIADRMEMHRFRCEKSLIPQAQKHTLSALLGQMQHLCRLDALVKSTAPSKRTQVELAVLQIAT